MADQFTLQQYNTLCAAIAQGVMSVEYGDKKVTYRSLAEMLQTKALMETALNIKRNARRKYVQHSKGLE